MLKPESGLLIACRMQKLSDSACSKASSSELISKPVLFPFRRADTSPWRATMECICRWKLNRSDKDTRDFLDAARHVRTWKVWTRGHGGRVVESSASLEAVDAWTCRRVHLASLHLIHAQYHVSNDCNAIGIPAHQMLYVSIAMS